MRRVQAGIEARRGLFGMLTKPFFKGIYLDSTIPPRDDYGVALDRHMRSLVRTAATSAYATTFVEGINLPLGRRTTPARRSCLPTGHDPGPGYAVRSSSPRRTGSRDMLRLQALARPPFQRGDGPRRPDRWSRCRVSPAPVQ